ncbi:hypothetical protein DBV05_g8394 [Lasiodiplodia theobromae]|uniref:Secreted protein n=1 Tax=Lasiodiplodia theobromae TaxID=45133 RepID=A0A5N5D5P6_9PEZI|nr:hypothetical protein DBV05_g8394 [Lasiodiplodia theobromae]
MQLTNTLLLTLSAVTLTIAAPQLGATPELGVAKDFPATDLDFLDFAIPDSPAAAAIITPTTTTTPSTNATATKLAPRQNGTVAPKRMRYCQHDNGRGECRNIEFPDMKCVNLDRAWDNRISSAYINAPWWCRWHPEKNCKGRRVDMRFPGIFNFKTVGMNDQASSFFCWHMF